MTVNNCEYIIEILMGWRARSKACGNNKKIIIASSNVGNIIVQ